MVVMKRIVQECVNLHLKQFNFYSRNTREYATQQMPKTQNSNVPTVFANQNRGSVTERTIAVMEVTRKDARLLQHKCLFGISFIQRA
jgi:hypothetical protein